MGRRLNAQTLRRLQHVHGAQLDELQQQLPQRLRDLPDPRGRPSRCAQRVLISLLWLLLWLLLLMLSLLLLLL